MDIQTLKEYLEEHESKEEIDLKDKTIQEIKLNVSELSFFYQAFFNKFKRDFKDLKNEEVTNLINKNNEIFLTLLSLNHNKNCSSLSKRGYERDIINYAINNYDTITEFFDICLEVYEDETGE